MFGGTWYGSAPYAATGVAPTTPVVNAAPRAVGQATTTQPAYPTEVTLP